MLNFAPNYKLYLSFKQAELQSIKDASSLQKKRTTEMMISLLKDLAEIGSTLLQCNRCKITLSISLLDPPWHCEDFDMIAIDIYFAVKMR